MSRENNHIIWCIRALNGLGWAHRQTGDLNSAQKFYREARDLYFQERGFEKEILREDFGWISNNLAHVLSYKNETRRHAIEIARSTIKHWKSLSNPIGLGAGYLALGVAYYRSGISEQALEAFEKAIEIFEPLQNNNWIGQIYSWRGALYLHINRREEAKNDLEESLRIGSENMKAMTLHRLGRVYMVQNEWSLAEKYMNDSLECAKVIPDYRYWLASIARLTIIAAEKGESNKLDEFQEKLKDCLDTIKNPAQNDLGIAYLGLAKLAIKQNLDDLHVIIEFLQRGIELVTEFGSYAHEDAVSRLENLIEKDFYQFDWKKIQYIGKELLEFFRKKMNKEKERPDQYFDMAYESVVPIIYRWANWKGENYDNA